MKKILSATGFVITIILLGGCHSAKQTTGDNNANEMLYKYKWYLTELEGQPFTFTGNNDYAHLLFTAGQPNKVSGSTGCNRLNGSFDLTGVNFIKFSPLATTRMACPGNTEAKFIEALGQVNNWSINNEQLLLNNGKILVAKLNGISMETDKLSGTWELNYLSGLKIAFEGLYPDKKPTLAFNFSAKEVGGNTSCNGFSSKYTINGNNINIAEPFAKTMMFCEGGGEQAFLNMLKKVNKYSISDNTLTFLIDDVAMMRFAKK